MGLVLIQPLRDVAATNIRTRPPGDALPSRRRRPLTLFSIEADSDALLVKVSRMLPPYARGAALLATLADPPMKAMDRHTLRIFVALGRIAMATQEDRDPDSFLKMQPAFPAHFSMDLKLAARLLREFFRRLDHRLAAAHAANPLMLEAKRGRTARVPYTVAQLAKNTIDREAERMEVLTRLGAAPRPRFDTDAKNFEQRVMRGSGPVLHLAAATAEAIHRATPEIAALPAEARLVHRMDVVGPNGQIGHQIAASDILWEPAFQNMIVERAESFEPLVRNLRLLRPKRIVKLRFV
jgi:hypothetical protein